MCHKVRNVSHLMTDTVQLAPAHPLGMPAPVVRLPDLESELIRIPAELDDATRTRHYRAARRAELRALAPGVYIPSERWLALDVDTRHLLRIAAAAARLRDDDVLSHWSAAALWGLPVIGSWPEKVQVTTPADSARRSTTVLQRHRRGLALPPHRFEDVVVTACAETVIDISRVASFATAVAIGDAALRRHAEQSGPGLERGASRGQMVAALAAAPENRGRARARRVLEFIDGAADRPGESLSRVTMHLLGIPAPVLQHRIVTQRGAVYYLDFFWPDQGIGGDFDGRIKYVDAAYRGGRSAEQVVVDEKVREDEIRLELRGYGRWDWQVAGSRRDLAERLRRIGLRW